MNAHHSEIAFNVMDREDAIRTVQENYRQLGRSLNEAQRRHWAATYAMKIGRGGITIVSKALRISPNTIKRGIQEISNGETSSFTNAHSRIRKPGGGRKSKSPEKDPLIRTKSNKDSAVSKTESIASERMHEIQFQVPPPPTCPDNNGASDNVQIMPETR